MVALQLPAGIGTGAEVLPRPVPLPGAPLLDHLFFESPWLVAGPLGVLAVVAVFVFNGRAELRRGMLVGAALLATAIAAWLTAALVTTARESVRAGTRELIDAVATADVSRLDEMLSDDIEIRYPGFDSPTREGLLRVIGRVMGSGGMYALASWRVAEVQATLDGPALARSQVLVRATHAASRVPASAWVRLKWERGADGRWRCFAVEPIDVR